MALKKTILFDFDGTIIDTNRIIREGLNFFARQTRGTLLTREEMTSLYGRPLEEQMHFLSPGNAQPLLDAFRFWYRENHDRMTSAFAGIPELLADLHQDGCCLGIVTNNSREGALLGLRHLNLESLFPVVVTCDDVTEKKPHPEGIFQAMRLLDSDPADTVFVGDSGNDLQAARNAGIPSVLVGWTSLDPQDLLTSRPNYIVHQASHIRDLVRSQGRQIA